MSDDLPLFELKNVFKSYRDAAGVRTDVLSNAAVAIAGRGLTALVGPSGQGKSTLLNLLGGLDADYTGTLLCHGKPVPKDEGDALRVYRGRCVRFVFQDLNLVSHLTAAENAALPLLCRGVPRRLAVAAATEAMALLGVADLAHRRPAKLSGGQRQRVAIARAFVGRPGVILADEPTGALDPANAERVMAAFATLCRERGRPCVVVTHNLDLAAQYADRVLKIDRGRIEDVTPAGPPAPRGGPSGQTGGRPRVYAVPATGDACEPPASARPTRSGTPCPTCVTAPAPRR